MWAKCSAYSRRINTPASPWRSICSFQFIIWCPHVSTSSSMFFFQLCNGRGKLVISPASCMYFPYQACFNREVGVPLIATFICSHFLFTAPSIHNEPPLPHLSSRLPPPLTLLLFHLPSLSLPLSVFLLCLSFTSCLLHSVFGVLRIAALSRAL